MAAEATGASQIAEWIRGRISTGGLSEGEPLPAERTLAESAGVSRTTIRSALAILESEGYVSRRVGRSGGTFASRPGAATVAASIVRVAGVDGFAAGDLAEARLVVEPELAALAALRGDSQALQRIEATSSALARCSERMEYVRLAGSFHRLVAQAAGNTLLTAIIDGVTRIGQEQLGDESRFVGRDELSGTLRAHEAILAALAKGDGPAARQAMARHVGAVCTVP